MSVVDQPEVRRLLLALSERPMEVATPSLRRTRRQRAIERIQRVLNEADAPTASLEFGRSRWAKACLLAALAAGLVLAASQLWRQSDVSRASALRMVSSVGEVHCRSGEGPWRPCRAGAERMLTAVTCQDDATTELETGGARLVLMPTSTLLSATDAKAPKARRVRLTQGRVDVSVPKLAPGQSFAVETETAVVTVHGTAFSVSVVSEGRGKSHTCVELREGVITVDSGGQSQRLIAPALVGCELEPSRSSADAQREAPEEQEVLGPVPSKSDASFSAAKKQSSLAHEIRLLQQGLAAEQRHDRAAADRLYRVLLKQYPHSIVAPEARAAVERLRIEAAGTR